MLTLKTNGMLKPCAPAGTDARDPRVVDEDEPPCRVGGDARSSALRVDAVERAKAGAPISASSVCLADPEAKGLTVTPNPASSGAEGLDLSSRLRLFGEGEGRTLIDALRRNVATCTRACSTPCAAVAAGVRPVGVAFELRAARLMNAGAPPEPAR